MGKLLDPTEAAGLLNVSPRTLGKWRYRRIGPPFKKLGTSHNAPVRYDEDELRAWVNAARTAPEGDEGAQAI